MDLSVLFGNDSRVARYLHSIEWNRSPVGPVERWDVCLQASFTSCVWCSFPACVLWGSELAVIPNQELCDLFDMKAAGTIGRPPADVWPGRWDALRQTVAQALKQRAPVRSDDIQLPAVSVCSEGEPHFAVSCSPIYDSKGRTPGVFCIFNETTEIAIAKKRVACEQSAVRTARRMDEHRLQTIIDQLPAGVGLTDQSGQWTLSNELMRRYIPTAVPSTLPERAAFWQAWDAHGVPIPPHDWPGARALRGETVLPGQEMLYTGVPGRRIWMRVSAAPLRDEADDLIGTCSIVQDISDLKVAEEALKDADHRKDEFLAVLAHELRNPLAPIRNGLHVLDHATNGDTRIRVHRMFKRQMSHIVRLVDDLLEVSRIKSGKIELRKQALNLSKILTNAVETSRPVIDKGQHQLTLSFSAEPLNVIGDPVRLTQIFANLLNNASKYSNVGGHIQVTAMRDDTDAVVSVRDDGIGISEAMLPIVFDMFSQAENSRQHAQGGLGIGLTLVQSLVRLHGGSVCARSDGLNQGSEFTIRLPLLTTATAMRNQKPEDEPFRQKSLAGRRILIVDDNVDAADSLAMLLEMLGAETRTAHGGLAALDMLKRIQADTVLLDVGMPDIDGYELARRIRAIDALAGSTLIAITGWGQEEDKRKSHEAGIDRHLVKPVDIVLLLEALTAPTD